jgi:hypothetical protein
MRHFLFLLALTAGCGTASDKSDSGKSETETQVNAAAPASYTMLLDSAVNLPACEATNEGQLVYLKTEAQFQACSAGAWAVVDIKGEKGDAGEAGAAGAAGEQGEAGEAGVDNHIVSSIGCNGILSGTSVSVSYSAALTAAGDVFVTGEVAGTTSQASSAKFYAASQTGAVLGAVIVVFDLSGSSNSGFWRLSLDRSTLVVSATYTDTDYAGGGQTWTMTPDDCTVNEY